MTNSSVESIFEWPIASPNQPSGSGNLELRAPVYYSMDNPFTYVEILRQIKTFIFQYARKTSSITRELSGNQFVIGDSEDESSEEEGD